MSSPEKASCPRTSKQRVATKPADALTLASWGTAALAFALCTPPLEKMANAVFMAGPVVVAPAGYTLALLLASAAIALMIAAFIMRRNTSRIARPARGSIEDGVASCKAHGDPVASPCQSELDDAARHKPNKTPVGPARQSGIGCGMRWLGNGIAAFAIVAAFATAGLFCLISEPYVADPPSYAGDRVVVVERNVFLAGNGAVYLVPHGLGLGFEIARYSADDGYSPMSNETYTLSWQGRAPAFVALGTPVDPVSMYPAKR